MPKHYLETVFLIAVVVTHIAAFLIIWFGPHFASPEEIRQDLTLIIAPVTAAYFLAAVRFAIANQSVTIQPGLNVRMVYVFVVVVVTLAFLGGVLGTLVYEGFLGNGISDAGRVKVLIGGIETFLGAAFALIAEDIFRQPITSAAVVPPAAPPPGPVAQPPGPPPGP